MAISYVGELEYTFSGTADTAARAGIPSAVQVGDLLICCFGNVAAQSAAATMNNSWTKLEEDTSNTNCYFLMAAKIATSTETAAAGSNVQIATLAATTGQTNKTAQTMAYRGTKSTVASAVIATNTVHETSPADETINTGSVSSTVNNQWYVFFYNMAAGNANGDQSTGTFSTSGGTIRGHATKYDSSTNSGCAGGDSNGTIAVQSWSRDGTWSSNSTRLNAGIAIIDPAATGTQAPSGTVTLTSTANSATNKVTANPTVIG